jgi:hypothetical protein
MEQIDDTGHAKRSIAVCLYLLLPAGNEQFEVVYPLAGSATIARSASS